jgi:hypothetical protein
MNYPSLGFGLGLRAPHYSEILDTRPKTIDFFEIISENFIDAHGGYCDFLADLRQDYPIIMHGVSLNIGSPDALNFEYLAKLKKLADFLDIPWFSDHLCWTGANAHNTHDLLPLPYTKAMLEHIVERVKIVQDFMGRKFIMENPSSYLEFAESTIPEYEFLAEIAESADCGVLLDVNNVFVSAFNHGFDAKKYIDTIPSERIAQIHLAGHSDFGTHIIDTHDSKVANAVWELYDYTIKTKGAKNTMIEWDEQIPSFAELVSELDKAKSCARQDEAA